MRISEELGRLMKTVAELEEARKGCEYDQSYFLYREIEAVEYAEQAFIQAMRNELGIHLSDNP